MIRLNLFHFEIGDKVQNILRGNTSDKERFRFRGEVVGRFRKKNGEARYVVEDSNGNLRLYSYYLEKIV